MALLEDLITEVDDPRLRTALAEEARELKQRMDFGLVFERHLPESVLLASRIGVSVGDEVRLRRAPSDERRLHLTALAGDHATVTDSDGNSEDMTVADLAVVKDFSEPIYPTLRSDGSVRRGDDRAPHLVIEAENYHALQLLALTHALRADCIYIDPPYNTGARDWKYNNAYVDENDTWRHSKWLSFMEKRLHLARKLLKSDGVLVVTIDENELHHLGVLIEDIFPDALRQMVTICINPSGAAGEGLSRVEEYALFVFLGGARPVPTDDDMFGEEGSAASETSTHGVRWERLMRGGNAWYRANRPNLCYPVLLSEDRTRILRAGERLEGDEADRPQMIEGHPVAWPVRGDGKLGIWRVQPSRLNWLVQHGYAHISTRQAGKSPTLRYLLEGTVEAIEAGRMKVVGRGDRGQVLVDAAADTRRVAKTVWDRGRHTAGGSGGTRMLNALLGERDVFSYPKSVYATRDCLEVAVGDRADALIIDFFAGSGTTLHATALLNEGDGGRRRCILTTNNEVEEKLAKKLHAANHFLGDLEYERHGIFEAATRPRCRAAISGQQADGTPVPGQYLDGRPYADGFKENCEFLRLDYLDPDRIELGLETSRLHPLLWLLAGGKGNCPEDLHQTEPFTIVLVSGYAVLFDPSCAAALIDAIADAPEIDHVFLFTESEQSYAQITAALGPERKTHMLPRDYLRRFRSEVALRP